MVSDLLIPLSSRFDVRAFFEPQLWDPFDERASPEAIIVTVRPEW